MPGQALVGAFEPVAKPWGMDGIPEAFCFDSLPEDMDHFEPILESATAPADPGHRRHPDLLQRPGELHPDDRYLLGETAELRDLFVACGFNSIGIQSSGGAGKVLAEWIRDRRMPVDLTDVDVRRLHLFQSNRTYLRDRTPRPWACSTPCTGPGSTPPPAVPAALAVPRPAGRGRCGHGRDRGLGAAELVRAARRRARVPLPWGRQNWFEHTAAECRAVRDAVALFDQSSFALVEGAGRLRRAEPALGGRDGCPAGRIVYTQWCNERAGSRPTSPSRASTRPATSSSPVPPSRPATSPGCEHIRPTLAAASSTSPRACRCWA